ncbi:MAG: serine/threonine protein kinase [Anaerolineaceae bacterium]|nr:serine/threonine protein kinase [Anaerolineaceae bacterium]
MNEPILIHNRYQLAERIGQGGMGTVYRAIDTRTGQVVAVKLLLHEILVRSGKEAIERFRREVEALRRLDHPNIIKLLGTAKDGANYCIIMEYAPGGSLAKLLEREGRLPLQQVLEFGLDIADALTRAHRLGIIHRDIKPDNVLLTANNTPRLTDFGVARIKDRTQLTQSGYVVGTGSYLSPEACRGHDLDARADIWAFGVLLYEMLAGQRPFDGTNPAAVITSILMEPLRDLRQYRSDVPEALMRLIRQMLEKNRDQRIASARQVGVEIEALLEGAVPAGRTRTLDITAFEDEGILELSAKWEHLAYEAGLKAAQLNATSTHQAYFQRGLANAYQNAAQDLRRYIQEAAATVPQESFMPNDPTTIEAYTLFIDVSRSEVEKVLKRARLKFSNLYEDNSHVFSAIFARMPPLPLEERIQRLTKACDTIIVLESGTLPDSGDPYIDFGFTGPPE